MFVPEGGGGIGGRMRRGRRGGGPWAGARRWRRRGERLPGRAEGAPPPPIERRGAGTRCALRAGGSGGGRGASGGPSLVGWYGAREERGRAGRSPGRRRRHRSGSAPADVVQGIWGSRHFFVSVCGAVHLTRNGDFDLNIFLSGFRFEYWHDAF
jgi:hypothetical protein